MQGETSIMIFLLLGKNPFLVVAVAAVERETVVVVLETDNDDDMVAWLAGWLSFCTPDGGEDL